MSGGPFRHAPVREICTACRELASARCTRCGVPLCASHAPPFGRCCIGCESTLESKIRRPAVFLIPLGVWLVFAAVITVGVGMVFIRHHAPLSAWISLVMMLTLFTPAVVGAARLIYSWFTRRRFFAQRSVAARLPVDNSEESWFEAGERW